MMFDATLQGRTLVLEAPQAGATLRLPLDQGGRYRIVAPDVGTIEQLIPVLESVAGVAIQPPEGGLLGAMTVSANLSLALRYGVEVEADMLGDWERRLQLALSLCGVSSERAATIGRDQPMRMERLERWMVGFLRQLLRPPELLVFDRAYAGLSRRQTEAVLSMESVYHAFHPFRPTLFVDLDAHGLPELPDCRGTLILEASVCLP